MISEDDIRDRQAARDRAVSLRVGDRDSRGWRPDEVELACEVFFGEAWWHDPGIFRWRSTHRTNMTDALNAAWSEREARKP